jgi:hypothetical protein
MKREPGWALLVEKMLKPRIMPDTLHRLRQLEWLVERGVNWHQLNWVNCGTFRVHHRGDFIPYLCGQVAKRL